MVIDQWNFENFCPQNNLLHLLNCDCLEGSGSITEIDSLTISQIFVAN